MLHATTEVGQGQPQPPVRTLTLAELIALLRDADACVGQPMLCPPLDSVDFISELDRQATRDVAQGQGQQLAAVDVAAADDDSGDGPDVDAFMQVLRSGG